MMASSLVAFVLGLVVGKIFAGQRVREDGLAFPRKPSRLPDGPAPPPPPTFRHVGTRARTATEPIGLYRYAGGEWGTL